MKIGSFKGRIGFIFFLFLLLALLMVVRLYFLQIVDGEEYAEKADRQYVNISTNTFDRGGIFFQNKAGNLVSAAGLGSGYILALNVKGMSSSTDYIEKISQIMTIDKESLYSKLANGSTYIEIARRVTEDNIKKVKDLDLPGIVIAREKWRYYPGNSLASRLIGFVAYDDSGEKIEGRYGLEKYYNSTLKRDGGGLYMNTFAQIFSNLGLGLGDNEDREGDVVTSIDPEVQVYFDYIINNVNEKWGSKVTGGIIIDPNTGDIYSMSVAPGFDLNNFKNVKDISLFSNPLVSDAYEMGSIIKPLTVAAGLDNGDITANTTYNDKGYLELDGFTIYNFDKKGRGIADMQTVLNNSLNTGVAFIADRLGKEKFLEYFQNYGIGTESGIDLPAEAKGNISNLTTNLKNSKKIEYATASFGQGISLTPIMTARALSVLANGGKLVIPHVAKKIEYKVGITKNISYTDEAKQVLKKETSEEITRMLINVVDKALLNGNMKMKNYSIAAKTGTAQIARPARDGGGYYSDKYLHSFFGYFPAYNPRFLVFLYTLEPKNVNYASQTLTEPFFDIAKFLINYYQIPPDR